MNQKILERAGHAIDATIQAGDLAGASLCVIHKNKEVYRKEFGMADKRREFP